MSFSHYLFITAFSFPFGMIVMRLGDGLNVNKIFKISGELSLWGRGVYNKSSN